MNYFAIACNSFRSWFLNKFLLVLRSLAVTEVLETTGD